jgi:hypothetical protein
MQVLHVLRTRPDETVTALLRAFAGVEGKTLALFEGEVDWDALVDDIFASESVISWW